MRLNKFLTATAIAATAMLLSTSCTSNKKYTALQSQYSELASKYHDSQVALAECNAKAASLDNMLDDAKKTNDDLKRSYAALQGSLNQSLAQNSQGNVNISKLVDQINESNAYIKRLVDAKTKSDSLLIALTNKLTRSLGKDELRDVDVKVLKGVVYISLADNMLFKSGSYEINDRAMETLSKIAKIIKDYNSYDVLVEGNTDNVPITRTNIRNNWDLSALRASSVVQVLQNDFGIDPARLSAADVESSTPSPTTIRKLANSVTAAPKSS